MIEVKKDYIPKEQSIFLISQTLVGMGFDKIGPCNYRDGNDNRVFICEMVAPGNPLNVEYEGRSATFSKLQEKLPSQ